MVELCVLAVRPCGGGPLHARTARRAGARQPTASFCISKSRRSDLLLLRRQPGFCRSQADRSSPTMAAALSGGETCVKYLMFAFNLVFWLAGTTVLAIGLWLRLDPQNKVLLEEENSPYAFYAGVYVLIGAGALVMVVGFLGCCGAIKESPCMLGVFFFFLLILFAIEVAAGIWGFSNQTKVVEDISSFYTQTYKDYTTTGDDRLRETLRLIQAQLKCCGPGKNMDESFKETCPRGEPLEEMLIKSCPDAIDEVFDSKLHVIGGVAIAMGVVMVFGMIFSMLLCCAIRKSQEVV